MSDPSRHPSAPGLSRHIVSSCIVAALGAGVVLMVMIGRSPAAGDGRERAVRSIHASIASVDDAEFDRDPGRMVRGEILDFDHSGGPARIVVVEMRALAATVQSSLTLDVARLPFDLPVSAMAESDERGNYSTGDVPLGRYSVYVYSPSRMPSRQDGVIVRDSVGGRAYAIPRPVETRNEAMPSGVPEGARWLPLYEGHWPDLEWRFLDGGKVVLERRDPDGWPCALVWTTGELAGWCRVTPTPQGGLEVVEISLEDLVGNRQSGPVALAYSPFAGLRQAHLARVLSACEDKRPPAPAAHSLVKIRSSEPYAAYEVVAHDGEVVTVFADRSGAAELEVVPGPALVRAIVGRSPTLPRGVLVRSAAIAEMRLPFADLFEQRVPMFGARVELPMRRAILGFVLEASGEPVTGATVAVYTADPDASRPHLVATNEHGFYRIDGLTVRNSYTLRYGRKAGFGDSLLEREVAVDDSNRVVVRQDFEMPGGAVDVTVPMGRRGDVVTVYRLGDDRSCGRVHLTATKGSVTLRDLPSGSYRLVLTREAELLAEVGLEPLGDNGSLTLSGDWRSL